MLHDYLPNNELAGNNFGYFSVGCQLEENNKNNMDACYVGYEESSKSMDTCARYPPMDGPRIRPIAHEVLI